LAEIWVVPTPSRSVSVPPAASPLSVSPIEALFMQVTLTLVTGSPEPSTMPLAFTTVQVWPTGWLCTATT
jgi:hypothetical protein